MEKFAGKFPYSNLPLLLALIKEIYFLFLSEETFCVSLSWYMEWAFEYLGSCFWKLTRHGLISLQMQLSLIKGE